MIFNLAITAILANKLRAFLTMLGIVIGVMSVILLISLVTGLQTFITQQIQGLGSNLMFVIPGRVGGARSPGEVQANRLVYQDSVNLRTKLAGDADVSASIQRNATLKFGNKNDRNVSVFGVEANYPKIISINLTAGRFFTTTVPWWSVLLSFGFSIIVGVVFGVAPAIRASKLDPITALRYE